MRLFSSVLKAFRVVATMPAGLNYVANTPADLSCDEDGALWVRVSGGGGGGSGSLANSTTFSSMADELALVGIYVARTEVSTGVAALQSVQAHAAEFCYLQLFSQDAPGDTDIPVMEWACPYPGGVSQEFGYPWGLRIPASEPGITFAFSSTPGILTLGPMGVVQGIYTYASP